MLNVYYKIKDLNEQEKAAFWDEEEKRHAEEAEYRAYIRKVNNFSRLSQSDSFARINNTKETSDAWCEVFKADPFAIDVFYVLISKANEYGTTFIDANGILSIMNISESKKEYKPGYRINIKSINKALDTLVKFGFIKEGCVNEENCYFLNSKYVLIRSLYNLTVCGYFPEDFIIESNYADHTWFSIDTHRRVLERNMPIMRDSKEAFAFHLVISHFMDIGNRINEKLNILAEIVGKSVRTLFSYFKFLFKNNLIEKKRAEKGAARVNNYGINCLFTYKRSYAEEVMQAFGLDFYDLRGTTGCRKSALNSMKSRNVSLRTQDDINEHLIYNEYASYITETTKDLPKTKEDAKREAKIQEEKEKRKKREAEYYSEQYCLGERAKKVSVKDIPLAPLCSVEEEISFDGMTLLDAKLILETVY